MDTVTLVATVAYPYAGRSLVAGERFEASPKHAALLKLIGRAVDAPAVPEPSMVRMRALRAFERVAAGLRYEAGDEFDAHDVEAVGLSAYGKAEVVAEPPAAEPTQPRQKRRYRRRDLRAEP